AYLRLVRSPRLNLFRLPCDRNGEGLHQRTDAAVRGVHLAPVDRCEQRAALLPLADDDLQDALAVVGGDAGKTIMDDAELVGIVGMDLDERLGQMRTQPLAQARARHGVPLIADTPGVEP